MPALKLGKSARRRQSAQSAEPALTSPSPSPASTELASDLSPAIANPRASNPTALLQLQRAAGNRAVNRLFSQANNLRRNLTPVQPQPSGSSPLKISQPNDLQEQQASRVARQVTSSASPAVTAPLDPLSVSHQPPTIQRLIDLDAWKTKKTANEKRPAYNLEKIDAALEAWHVLPNTAGFDALKAALKNLETAITAWKLPEGLEAPRIDFGRSRSGSVSDSDDEPKGESRTLTISEQVEQLGDDVEETLEDLAKISKNEKKISAWQLTNKANPLTNPAYKLRTHLQLQGHIESWGRGWEGLEKGQPGDPYPDLSAEIGKVTAESKVLYEKALAEQADLQAKLNAWIAEGLMQTKDPLLKNSCELIVTRKIPALALYPTPDSAERLEATKSGAKNIAYFPGLPGQAGYDWQDLTDKQNLTFLPAAFGGGAVAGRFYMMPNVMGRRSFAWRVIKHEIQHLADKHPANADPLTTYKTEYRAYFYMGEKNIDKHAHDDKLAREDKPAGWKKQRLTSRQAAILKTYSHEYPDRYQKLTEDPASRRAVSKYRNPDTEGFNKFNSVRIDYFYDALERVNYPARIQSARAALVGNMKTLKPHLQDWLGHYCDAYEKYKDPAKVEASANRRQKRATLPLPDEAEHNHSIRYARTTYDAAMASALSELDKQLEAIRAAAEKLLPDEKAFILQNKSYKTLLKEKLLPAELSLVQSWLSG